MGGQICYVENYSYFFTKETGLGVLYLGKPRPTDPLCNIYVLQDVKDEGQYAVENVTHKHLLRCIFTNRKDRHIVFEALQTLQVYKQAWINQEKGSPIRSYVIPGKHDESLYIMPFYRSIIRQLYTLVIDLHRLNFSLQILTMNHLWISDGSLKVCGTGLIRSTSALDRKKIFKWVISVMKEIISPIGAQRVISYPLVVSDLIKKKKKPKNLPVAQERTEDFF